MSRKKKYNNGKGKKIINVNGDGILHDIGTVFVSKIKRPFQTIG